MIAARERQLNRFAAGKERIYANAQMGSREIRKYCELGTEAEHLLERAMVKQGLSARAHDRILKVARTIADLAGSADNRGRPHRRGHPVPHPRPHLLGMKDCIVLVVAEENCRQQSA